MHPDVSRLKSIIGWQTKNELMASESQPVSREHASSHHVLCVFIDATVTRIGWI